MSGSGWVGFGASEEQSGMQGGRKRERERDKINIESESERQIHRQTNIQIESIEDPLCSLLEV